MTTQTDTNGTRPRLSRRLMGWSIPVLLLLVPFAAGAPWTPSDYVVAGALFTIVGLGIELAPAFAASVAPGATVILAGLLDSQADAVIAAYETQAMKVIERGAGEWCVLVLAAR